ncbi:hypothetical protein [Propionivibrio sp.]|uniref:hypothetical protein n=1 Tax=Propionivibrio sp. TaxID=2212460 RepID=UPI0025EAD4F1|nr:hypothetical protein [Propionivibrio sp.]
MPAPSELLERLDTVLRVIYLVFNEGLFCNIRRVAETRHDLSGEAIRPGATARRFAART